jgi:hypothetical protein
MKLRTIPQFCIIEADPILGVCNSSEQRALYVPGRNQRAESARDNARLQHQAILTAPHEYWGNVGAPRLPKNESAAVLNGDGDVGYLEPHCDSVRIVHSEKC